MAAFLAAIYGVERRARESSRAPQYVEQQLWLRTHTASRGVYLLQRSNPAAVAAVWWMGSPFFHARNPHERAGSAKEGERIFIAAASTQPVLIAALAHHKTAAWGTLIDSRSRSCASCLPLKSSPARGRGGQEDYRVTQHRHAPAHATKSRKRCIFAATLRTTHRSSGPSIQSAESESSIWAPDSRLS